MSSPLHEGATTDEQPQLLAEQARQTREEAVHPLIGSLIGPQSIEIVSDPIDSPEDLLRLERIHRATEYIQGWYNQSSLTPLQRALGPLGSQRQPVARINNQFATKLTPCFMDPDPNVGLEKFRAIVPNTVAEETVLLTHDDQFMETHAGLATHLDDRETDMQESIADNLKNIAVADRMQFNGQGKRSLEYMQRNGMAITLAPENAHLIEEAHQLAGEGILPLTEYIKNSKIFCVSGFESSKVSLAIHDYMDHLWTFSMLERAGILERYSFMFDSIGNPEATDIYKREGEIVASIAFGVRYFQTMPSAFGPLMRSSQIEEHLDQLFVQGDLEGRHMEAYRTLKSLRKGSMEWQSLGFSFSNYITELDQQRRKFGRIKQRDPRTKRLIGELDPLSPDFLAFFIDAHHQLLSSRNKHRDDLFRIHILIEEYLTSYAKKAIPGDQPFVIKPSELRNMDFTATTLPPQRIQWMRDNHGFTATRDAII